jgi:CheY-like chemotaxis protein
MDTNDKAQWNPRSALFTPSASCSNEADKKDRATTVLLIVEDHKESASALAFLLRHEGYQVKTASTVAEALHLAAETRVDLVISDIYLPDGDGRELMAQLHSTYQLNGIAMTGSSIVADGLDVSTGFLQTVVKPIQFSELISAVQHAAETHNH